MWLGFIGFREPLFGGSDRNALRHRLPEGEDYEDSAFPALTVLEYFSWYKLEN